MSENTVVVSRLFAVARAVVRRNHHRLGTYWTMRDPLPLLRLCLRTYRAVTRREFSDADPFGLVVIDPRAVTHVSNRAKEWDSWLGEVVEGDWDRRSVSFDEVPIVRVITDYIEGGEPLDCDCYREYYTDEHRRVEPFGVRCERLTNLIWDIEQDGYRTQRELLEREDLYTLQGQNNDTVHPLLNEIRVDIDRDGGFHHCGVDSTDWQSRGRSVSSTCRFWWGRATRSGRPSATSSAGRRASTTSPRR